VSDPPAATEWLIDKSALTRLGVSADAAAWAERIQRGLVRIATVTLLADRGQHRAPSVPDLIIAAIAETAGLVVLHNDKDFDLIADVTGQPVQRLNG